jgi:L-alanine-DL-glutamate epimerase-like enolase superfamily enzyme
VRIVRLELREHRIPLRESYAISSMSFDAAELVELRLVTDGLALGLGCAAPAPEVTGETAARSAEALRGPIAAAVEGRSLATLDERGLAELAQDLRALPAARAALDMALHDLRAQERGLPLHALLGRVHAPLPTSVTLGVSSLEETLAAAERALARGFRALKLKTARSLDADIERVQKLRERCGPLVALRVDPNAGLTRAELAHFLDATRTLDLELVEQPLPRGAEEELRDFPAALRARFAADESLHDERDVEGLLRPPRPFGVWNLKLMKTGGIAPALEIADAAAREGVALMWGCNDESCVSIAAALAAALAAPATRFLDLDGSFDLSHDFARGGFALREGCLHPLDRPGLGVELLD